MPRMGAVDADYTAKRVLPHASSSRHSLIFDTEQCAERASANARRTMKS